MNKRRYLTFIFNKLEKYKRRIIMKRKINGFTIIELMITVTTLGILVTVGVPYLLDFINGQKVLVAAQSLNSGLQIARSTALKENQTVQFIVANNQWQISDNSGVIKQSQNDIDPNVNVQITPNGASTITFNPLGIIQANPDGSPTITQINTILTGKTTKQFEVDITDGGGSRVCNPTITASKGSVTAC